MRVATVMPSMPATVLPPALAPASQLPPSTPAMDLYYRINRDLLRLPGVRSLLLFGARRPNEIGINVIDERAAAAVAGVLEPKLGEVALQVYIGSSANPYTGPGGRLADRIAVIDALTGVWDHKVSLMRRGSGTATFRTIDQSVIDRLDPLIRDRFEMGVDTHGWKILVNVRWQAGLPAA